MRRLREKRGLKDQFKGQIPEMTGAPEEQVRGPGTGTDRGASPDLTAERGQTDLTAEIADKVVGIDPEGHRRGPYLHVPGDTPPPLPELVLVTGQGEQGQEADDLQVRDMTE